MELLNRRMAIEHHYPDLLHGNGYEKKNDYLVINRKHDGSEEFYWNNEKYPEPTDAEMQVWFNEQLHVRPRAAAYSSVGEQLGMQYDDLVNGTTTWKDHVVAVKTKYPKA